MDKYTYDRAKKLLSEINKTEILLKSLKQSKEERNNYFTECEYSIEINGTKGNVDEDFFDKLVDLFENRIEELNQEFKEL